ncbi:hypothetical protein TKK_0017467 [Trichogramma kaykai]|uniref:peptidyl-tRNA hydrolase n=1 Tax=Trichogramma kaykai TaxID=54128 RepID=A0ABD2W423_9HYME
MKKQQSSRRLANEKSSSSRSRSRSSSGRSSGSSNRSWGQSNDAEGPEAYVIYCIVNTSYFSNKGSLAESVARGFLALYNKVDKNRVNARALDAWEETGERLVVLNGLNHRHLKYLAEELKYVAVDTHCLNKAWGKSQLTLVLSTIGREEDLEEYLDGLNFLR